MSYITGINRDQSTLFPEVLDDYINTENPVRFIDAYVDALDLRKLSFTHTDHRDTGRPPYDPSDLLKLYIYGYLNRIRSSRQLEQATHRNVEVLWLMRRLQPDFKTIADFRKDNSDSLKQVCREFTLLCKRLDLFGGELIGIDGSKFSAVNHNTRHFTKKKLVRMLAEINEKIDAYVATLDASDQVETVHEKKTGITLQEKIAHLHRNKEQLVSLQDQLISSGQIQMATTDPDSRMMRTATGGSDMSYNVQMAVDDKHKLIVEHDVINAVNDRNALLPMAQKAKDTLGSVRIDVVADMGYFNEEAVKACEGENIHCYVAIPPQPNGKQYAKSDFRYEAERDCYHCPADNLLPFHRSMIKEKKRMRVYEGASCQGCRLRSRCTRSDGGNRQITRWEHEHVIEAMRERLACEPEKLDKRKCLVEHPFGTIKRWMDQKYFLTRGKAKVSGEMAMSVLAYNIKRVLSIVGVHRLLEVLQEEKIQPELCLALIGNR